MEETIYYDNEGKRYFVLREGRRRYLSSVTNIIQRHCFLFTEEILQKAAEKKTRGTKKSAADQLAEWKTYNQEAIDYGNEFHDSMSDTLRDKARPLTQGAGGDVWEYKYVNPFTLPDGVHREVRVFSTKYLVAARIDELTITTKNGKRCVTINDFKTGRLVDYKVNDLGDPYRMTGLLRRMPDSTVGKAIMQLSCYGYLLQTHGFYVENLSVSHKRSMGEEVHSRMLKLIAEGMYSTDGLSVLDVYYAPYKIKEAFLLFSNNRLNFNDDKPRRQEETKFSDVWN